MKHSGLTELRKGIGMRLRIGIIIKKLMNHPKMEGILSLTNQKTGKIIKQRRKTT